MMKKLMIFMTMVLVSGLLMAEIYTGTPDFLPYGLNCIGQPTAPGWLPQKADPNGFQGAYYYDANGNYHEGRANPELRVFYANGAATGLDSSVEIKKLKKMLIWIILRICDTYGYRIPGIIR